MAVIDYIFIGALVIALIVGIIKGLLSMTVELGGFLLGIFVAGKFSTVVSGWMESLIASESTRNLVAYLICLIVTIIIVSIIGKILKNMCKKVKILKSINRVLGGVVSVALVYGIFALIFALMTVETEISLINVVLDFIEGLVPTDCITLTLFGEGNAVGNWLASLIFPSLY